MNDAAEASKFGFCVQASVWKEKQQLNKCVIKSCTNSTVFKIVLYIHREIGHSFIHLILYIFIYLYDIWKKKNILRELNDKMFILSFSLCQHDGSFNINIILQKWYLCAC